MFHIPSTMPHGSSRKAVGQQSSICQHRNSRSRHSRITPCLTYMVMANGQTDKIGGEVELIFTIDVEEITTHIRVSNSLNYDIILGMDLMERPIFESISKIEFRKLQKVPFIPVTPKTRILVPFMQ